MVGLDALLFTAKPSGPRGGPSGGNGGRGGSVVLEATDDLNSLVQQFYQPWIVAKKWPSRQREKNGGSVRQRSRCHGSMRNPCLAHRKTNRPF
ncbi:MAG: hypothetical protein LR011_13440 [Verrucomicrobia bacterium]|nr:hypothetical protein [Verrucomicrobiota bacterium]